MGVKKEVLPHKNSIVIKNRKIKTLLTEETRKKGYMPIEEARRLTHERLIQRWFLINKGL